MSRSISSLDRYEREYPFKVQISTPADGLGGRLNEMMSWCAGSVPQGDWQVYGARFYFRDREPAEAFQRE